MRINHWLDFIESTLALPDVWPNVSRPLGIPCLENSKDSVRERLDDMAREPLFMTCIMELESADLWTSVDPENALTKRQQATILMKRCLHVSYDLVSGTLLRKRIEDLSGQPAGTLRASILAMCAANINDTKETHGTSAKCMTSNIETIYEIASFDALGWIIQTVLSTSGALQRMFLDHLRSTKCVFPRNIKVLDFVEHPQNREDLWKNVYFHLGLMWLLIKLMRTSIAIADPKELVRTLHKARIWSMGHGLVQSLAGLQTLDKKQYKHLESMKQVAAFLHALYLRAWPTGLEALNVKRYASEDCLRSKLCAMSKRIFATSTVSVPADAPDCGTAVLVYPYGPTIRPIQMGFENLDGTKVLGSEDSDINYVLFVGFLSAALTQTHSHLVTAITCPEVWSTDQDSLETGLPTSTLIQTRLLEWIRTTPWAPTELDLKDDIKRYRKMQRKCDEILETHEIQRCLQTMEAAR